MKKSNIYFKIGLVILMVGFLMTVSSCSKKKSRLDPMEQYPTETEISAAGEQGGDAAQSLSEEELEAQRFQEQEAVRIKEAARMKFVDEDVYFNFDDATLTSSARQVIKQKVAWLRENPGASVLIEGHCDERGTEEYNIALGQRRAQSIKTFLMNAGISTTRLSTVSYGEERPVDFGNNESAWAKNRRAHFKLQN
ncbi:MAG: peptidoglycan-associated lipoprotein Pal [Desulfobacteraceae bacterium]|nr:peptidoglycan-associated lipoprotein Pal [Desulfobacteraceae bacterium]MBC2754140.1 peptidoglycan-associated lipoprotein Pal [Desulfobacteraceae bacterium]